MVRPLTPHEGQRAEHHDNGNGQHHAGTGTAPVVHGVERESLSPIGAGRSRRLCRAQAPTLEGAGIVENDRSIGVGEFVCPPYRYRRYHTIGGSQLP